MPSDTPDFPPVDVLDGEPFEWIDLPTPEVIDTFVELTAATDGYHVPEELKDLPIWVLWNFRSKNPLAPWKDGHCYGTKWKHDMDPDERPEITYEEAKPWADLTPEQLDDVASFPRTDKGGDPVDQPVPDRIGATFLLPPNPTRNPRLMYVDLDDVRDPETGFLAPEAAMIVERLGSATYVSSSGTGIHVVVWATLPDHCAAVPGADLKSVGSIELYDQRRFFAGTWEHVAGTPTEVHERQDVIDALIECYYPPGTAGAATSTPNPQDKGDASAHTTTGSVPKAGPGDRSPYYDAGLEHFAEPDPIEVQNADGPQGAHPHHGKTTGSPGEKSTNYNLDTNGNRWHCFAHSSGGGALEMAAVMAGVKDCRHFGRGTGVSSISDVELLKTCVYARDNLHGFNEDMDPPYAALRGITELFDMSVGNDTKGILGPIAHKTTRSMYDMLTVERVDDAIAEQSDD